MTLSPSMAEGRQMVLVALSDIPYDLRHTVAQELVDRAKLRSDDALRVRLAAEAVLGNPRLRVPAWKAELVMAGKRPPGETPQGLW